MRFFKALQILLSRPGRWFFRLRFCGVENIPGGGVVIASNHIHLTDPILHAFCLPFPFHTMAKKELFRFKPFGWLISRLGAFPVDRGHGDHGAVKRAVQIVEEEGPLLIFPEGTRSKTGALGAFKTGAAMISMLSGAPVVPALIYAPRGVGFRKGVVIEYGAPFCASDLGITEATGASCRLMAGELRRRVEEMRAKWDRQEAE